MTREKLKMVDMSLKWRASHASFREITSKLIALGL